MYKVKFTCADLEWPWQRQTPGESGIWGDCQFFINSDLEECDFWVVQEDLYASQTTLCPPHNTLLITSEPPSVKSYPPGFVQQFETVITCHRQLRASHVIYSQPSLPWHVGRRSKNHINLGFSKNYDELSALAAIEKKRPISVITSNKAFTRGHRQRIEFVQKLKRHFGSALDVYGRGINEIEDKWDALRDYRYHIALENYCCPDYWTEKLSDAYLAYAMPIYYGCPNLAAYFSESAYIPISYDLNRAVATIEKILQDDPYPDFLPAIQTARKLVLDRYNLFPRLHDYIHQAAIHEPKIPVSLKPAAMYTSLPFRAGEKLAHLVHRFI